MNTLSDPNDKSESSHSDLCQNAKYPLQDLLTDSSVSRQIYRHGVGVFLFQLDFVCICFVVDVPNDHEIINLRPLMTITVNEK